MRAPCTYNNHFNVYLSRKVLFLLCAMHIEKCLMSQTIHNDIKRVFLLKIDDFKCNLIAFFVTNGL